MNSAYLKKGIGRPVILALLLHLLFVGVSMVWKLPSIRETVKKTASFRLGDVDVKPREHRPQGMINASSYKQLSFVGQSQSTGHMIAPPEIPLGVPSKNQTSNRLEKSSELPRPFLPSLPSRDGSSKADLEKILNQSSEKRFQEKIQPLQKPVNRVPAPALYPQTIPLTETQMIENIGKPLGKLNASSMGSVALDPEEGMQAFVPMANTSIGSSGLDFGQGIREKGKLAAYDPLDTFLNVEVYTYQHPPTGEKYFMIKIFANPKAKTFKAMAKELIFVIDASLSISPDRLEKFKRGIRESLKGFNRGDVFNIIAFKEDTVLFAPVSVPPTADNIKKAERFVSALTPSEQTDVYRAFEKVIRMPATHLPSNILLLSDGRPTHGIQDSRELIGLITRLNDNVRPIFSFSGGVKVNRYLLDFISYQNRGWSQFVRKTYDIDTGLSALYEKIKDPLFLNLRYRFNNLNSAEIFPKSLPDFYRNAEFILYGKYDEENQFSMQLLGDIHGETKELIFSRSLTEAKTGGEEIMRGYAFNKIYHLISQMTLKGQEESLRAEIEKFSKQYSILTPYSDELQKID